MKKKFVLFLLLCCATIPTLAQETIFPTPSTCHIKSGYFVATPNTTVKGNGKYAKQLAKNLKTTMATLSLPEDGGTGRIVLKQLKEDKMIPESYELKVTENQVLLTAEDEAGMRHAYEAILQLLRFEKGRVKCCEIKNTPRYGWRGFMLDESRHFFGKEKVKQYLDLMAMLHMNVFHWHLTDVPGWRIEIKRYPKLTTEASIGNWHDPKAESTFYTQKDIREIVDYAAERKIMIVPEFDMPGHATAVCKAYPEVSGGGEGRWKHFTFHPCKEETFEFIGHIMDELFELFPSPYIHIGGDEVHFGNQSWYTDPEIQQFIKEHKLGNEVGMEHYFIRRIADMVAQKGRTIIAWDEAIEAGVAPEKMIVMWWRHDREKNLAKALNLGYRVILTPRRPLYADFVQHDSHKIGRRWNGFCPLEDIYHFPNKLMPILKGHEKQILGLQMNLWTERVMTPQRADFMVLPRLAGTAEAGWTLSENKNEKGFMSKLPAFLKFLDTMSLYYFNPFEPKLTPEPWSPEQDDPTQNG